MIKNYSDFSVGSVSLEELEEVFDAWRSQRAESQNEGERSLFRVKGAVIYQGKFFSTGMTISATGWHEARRRAKDLGVHPYHVSEIKTAYLNWDIPSVREEMFV